MREYIYNTWKKIKLNRKMYGRSHRRTPQALISAKALLKCASHSFRSSFVSAESKCLQESRSDYYHTSIL